MKMSKRKIFVTALAICLVSVISMGTLAYFSDEDSATNKFMFADTSTDDPANGSNNLFSVDLYEESNGTTVDYRDFASVNEDGIEYKDILPGTKYEKKAWVENTGKYSEYVRVIITISDKDAWTTAVDNNDGTTPPLSSYDFIGKHFIGFDAADWDASHIERVEIGDTVQYTFYLNNALAKGDKYQVFTHFELPAQMTAEDVMKFDADGTPGFTIQLKAQAVQTENVGTDCYSAFQTVLAAHSIV